jgi:hypothetical protein
MADIAALRDADEQMAEVRKVIAEYRPETIAWAMMYMLEVGVARRRPAV